MLVACKCHVHHSSPVCVHTRLGVLDPVRVLRNLMSAYHCLLLEGGKILPEDSVSQILKFEFSHSDLNLGWSVMACLRTLLIRVPRVDRICRF